MADGRFRELDGLRGLAAAGVVAFHVLTLSESMQLGLDPWSLRLGFGAYGVQLFFLISGFVILLTVRRSRNAMDFVVARLTRLYPAFWVSLTITLAVSILGPLAWMSYSAMQVLANYTMVPEVFGFKNVDGSYWTLFVELVFYAVMAVAAAVGVVRDERRLVSLAVAWSLASVAIAAALYPVREQDIIGMISTALIIQYAPLFATGMLMLLVRERGVWDHRVFLTAASAVATAALVQSGAAALATAGMVVVFLWVTTRRSVPMLRSRPVTFLGDISYPWYLLHQNISYVVLAMVSNRWLGTVAALLGTIALAWVVHRTVEIGLSPRLRRSLRATLVHRGAIPASQH